MTKTYDNAIRTGKEFLGQVVTTVYTGKTTYSVLSGGNAGTYMTVLDTSITPTASNSKIRVDLNITGEFHHNMIFRVSRSIDGGAETEVVRNDDANYWSGWGVVNYDANDASTAFTNHYICIDSPNTTSTVEYHFMIQSAGIATRSIYLNRTQNSTGAANYENGVSQAMLTEILVV